MQFVGDDFFGAVIVKSSANLTSRLFCGSKDFTSLTFSKYAEGAKTVPCGAPLLLSTYVVSMPSTTTRCLIVQLVI